MAKVVVRINNIKMWAAWQSWIQYVADHRNTHTIKLQMHLRYLATLQYKAMERWALFHAEGITNRAKMRQAVSFMKMTRLTSAFRGWRHNSQVRIARKKKLRKVAMRLKQHRLFSSYNGWARATMDMRRLRAKARAVAVKVCPNLFWRLSSPTAWKRTCSSLWPFLSVA